jgi:hypothetical protein
MLGRYLRSSDQGETIFDPNTVAVKTPREDRDHLDDVLLVWAREIPNLDPPTEGIVER